ncbi:hypothetical protein CHS0354_000059 [Potamilus streckersoni]|uniref:Uncharacterized protein n=1 Tax=Potamilus streckersoni TaxID=2493646 RepID=A0AAE0RUC1_9BIVA|nr:hypothetical protein CHS0354_000059 [Potamilus streckersoni]
MSLAIREVRCRFFASVSGFHFLPGNQFNPFSIEGVSGSIGTQGSGGSGGSGSRGSFSHPAYSMFMHMPMAFPGSIPDMIYGGASHNGGMECIRGNIVCPEYCIMVDEWGCKACPCGPGKSNFAVIDQVGQSFCNVRGVRGRHKGGGCNMG